MCPESLWRYYYQGLSHVGQLSEGMGSVAEAKLTETGTEADVHGLECLPHLDGLSTQLDNQLSKGLHAKDACRL